MDFEPDMYEKTFFENASDEQISYLPREFELAKIGAIRHMIAIITTNDPHELKDIDPKKISLRNTARKFIMDARDEKEARGEFFWTLGLFGTQAMADEANMTLEEYWEQIIQACFLNEADPIAKWKEVFSENARIREKLNALDIRTVHVVGNDVNLHVSLGENRQWLGGSGHNIPSFEIFTSPDWRGTSGMYRSNQPFFGF